MSLCFPISVFLEISPPPFFFSRSLFLPFSSSSISYPFPSSPPSIFLFICYPLYLSVSSSPPPPPPPPLSNRECSSNPYQAFSQTPFAQCESFKGGLIKGGRPAGQISLKASLLATDLSLVLCSLSFLEKNLYTPQVQPALPHFTLYFNSRSFRYFEMCFFIAPYSSFLTSSFKKKKTTKKNPA